jgi:hypothetical protein
MEPKWMLALNMLKQSPKRLSLALSYRNLIGILVKVKDELSGEVHRDGTVSKALGEPEHDRLNKGIVVAKNILRALECKPQSIVVGEAKGAHPSGTCRIGDVVDKDLRTEIKNLYACDASIFPEALDAHRADHRRLRQRLSRHLLTMTRLSAFRSIASLTAKKEERKETDGKRRLRDFAALRETILLFVLPSHSMFSGQGCAQKISMVIDDFPISKPAPARISCEGNYPEHNILSLNLTNEARDIVNRVT